MAKQNLLLEQVCARAVVFSQNSSHGVREPNLSIAVVTSTMEASKYHEIQDSASPSNCSGIA